MSVSNNKTDRAYGDQMVLECSLNDASYVFKCPSGAFAGFEKQHFENSKVAYNELIHIPDRPLRLTKLQNLKQKFESHGAKSLNFKLTYRIKDAFGILVPVQENGLIMRDKERDEAFVHSVISISKTPKTFARDTQAKAIEQATKEDLSALHNVDYAENRDYIETQLEKMCDREGLKPAFMVLGIDQLSIMNSVYGFEATDILLCHVDRLVSDLVRHKADIRRIGGDKFGLIVHDEKDYKSLANKILNTIHNSAMDIKGHKIWLGACMGVYCLGEPPQHHSFIEKAETALTEALKRGRGAVVEFDPKTMPFHEDYSKSVLGIGEMFLNALHTNRLKMAYQPVMDTKTRSVMFYETLIRLIDGQGNIVNAHCMAPALHELGMIRLVDFFALKSALSELMEHKDLILSVNVAQTTLIDNEWQELLLSQIRDNHNLGERIIIEVTENGIKEPIERLEKAIQNIRRYGVRVAIDDFGSGHTNFSELLRLDIDFVKIDKQFVTHMDKAKSNQFIRAIRRLAETMGAITIGEGVETAEQELLFDEQGVSSVQGYLYGQPTIQKRWSA